MFSEKLKAKISEMESRENELLQQKEQQEEDFGLKRAKLKDLYLQKEGIVIKTIINQLK